MVCLFFFFQAEDGIRDHCVTGVQTCALPISWLSGLPSKRKRRPWNYSGPLKPREDTINAKACCGCAPSPSLCRLHFRSEIQAPPDSAARQLLCRAADEGELSCRPGLVGPVQGSRSARPHPRGLQEQL